MKLFAFELAWASVAFDAVLPEHPALPHGIARLEPARPFAEMVAAAPLEQALGLRLALWLVALAPLWLLRRPRTIATVSAGERQRVLALLLASPGYAVRQLALVFKATASMLYARSPEARRAMTVPAPTTSLVRLRPRPESPGGSHDSAAE
jgi:hypothetical protein